MVNRASACALQGFYRDAIADGEEFFRCQSVLPAETAEFVPYAHHAKGFAYDRFKDYDRAIAHYRLAVELRDDSYCRAVRSSDLEHALVMAGRLDEADLVLAQIADSTDTFPNSVTACTTSRVRDHQQRFDDAVASAARAVALAAGKEELWASPLAAFRYWHSRATWELRNRDRAATLALRAALATEELRLIDLRDMAK